MRCWRRNRDVIAGRNQRWMRVVPRPVASRTAPGSESPPSAGPPKTTQLPDRSRLPSATPGLPRACQPPKKSLPYRRPAAARTESPPTRPARRCIPHSSHNPWVRSQHRHSSSSRHHLNQNARAIRRSVGCRRQPCRNPGHSYQDQRRSNLPGRLDQPLEGVSKHSSDCASVAPPPASAAQAPSKLRTRAAQSRSEHSGCASAPSESPRQPRFPIRSRRQYPTLRATSTAAEVPASAAAAHAGLPGRAEAQSRRSPGTAA